MWIKNFNIGVVMVINRIAFLFHVMGLSCTYFKIQQMPKYLPRYSLYHTLILKESAAFKEYPKHIIISLATSILK